MKTINDDLNGFFAQGGWTFLETDGNEGNAGDGDDSDGEEDDYDPEEDETGEEGSFVRRKEISVSTFVFRFRKRLFGWRRRRRRGGRRRK